MKVSARNEDVVNSRMSGMRYGIKCEVFTFWVKISP